MSPATVVFALHKPGALEIARNSKRRQDVVCGVAGRRGCWATWLEDLEREASLGRGSLFQIGRLDKATTGLLLVTNDGDLAYGLTRPGEVVKRYVARVSASPSKETLDRLRRGVVLGEVEVRVDDARVVGDVRRKAREVDAGGTRVRVESVDADVEVDIRSGQNRVVRRVLAAVGLPVMALRRVRFGGLALDTPESTHRRLTDAETSALWDAIGGRGAVAAFKDEDRDRAARPAPREWPGGPAKREALA